MQNIKTALLNQIISDLDEKINEVRTAIENAKESRDSETKSSVGDKYETGRTLMQMEVEKNRALLIKIKKLKADLLKINPQKKFQKAAFGSIVQTTDHTYFISAAMGQIWIKGKPVFCISLASPAGKQLQNRSVNDEISLAGKATIITDIF